MCGQGVKGEENSKQAKNKNEFGVGRDEDDKWRKDGRE